MTKGDLKVILISLSLVTILWAGFSLIPKAQGNIEAVVRIDGVEVARFPASHDEIEEAFIEVSGGTAIIEYGMGKTRVSPLSKHCPDGICWRTGWLTKSGQSAVCLPNHMTLTLEGGPSDIDSVVR